MLTRKKVYADVNGSPPQPLRFQFPLDGLHTPTQIVARAVELGCTSVAVTDHGDCGGHIEFLDAAHKAGIKPILGCEFYVVEHADIKTVENKKRFHLTLWAQNRVGLENIWALSTLGYIEGFYSKPRIDWAMLEAHSEGVVCGSACLAGHVSQAILEDDMDSAQFYIKYFKTIFPERFFLEIHTNGLDEQRKVNIALVDLAVSESVPMTFACDAHYSRPEDYDYHEALIGINTRKTTSDSERWTWRPDFHMMDEAEVRSRLEYLHHDVVEAALLGSEKVADLIEDLEFDNTLKMPHIEPPEWFIGTHSEYLVHLCTTCFQTKLLGHAVTGVTDGRLVISDEAVRKVKSIDMAKYIERLSFELDFIIEHGLTEYFMVVSDYTLWARNVMLVGPARGSAGGSLVSYLAGITTIDPIKYNLPFERFLNVGRLGSLPDIDLDFPTDKRELVKEYIQEKHGATMVASVGTIGRFKAASSLKDACFYLNVSFSEANTMSKLFETIPNVEGLVTWDDWVDAIPDQTRIRELIEERPKLFDLASHLMGTARQSSEHAAALIVSPSPLVSILPLRKKKDSITTQFDGKSVERLGFLKADILGLRTLVTLQVALDLIEERHGVKIDLARLDDDELDDPKVWEMLCAGKTLGVFQCETTGITGVIKKMKPNKVEDLSAAVALYRPGVLSSGMLNEYQKRRNGDKPVVYGDQRLEPILAETFGVMVYQEQIMEISKALAGYTPVEADNMRSILGKKKRDKMAAEEVKFVSQCIEHGMDETFANSLFADIKGFAEYSFNKSHSLAYGLLAYWCAYIKANYPVEMMCALMNTDPKKMDRYIKECHVMGIQVSPPHVNVSQDSFTIDGDVIVFGMQGIKFLGEAPAEAIKAGRPYLSIEDFFSKNAAGVVNKRNIESLMKLGAFEGMLFDDTAYNGRELLEMFSLYGKKKGKPTHWLIDVHFEDDEPWGMEDFTNEESAEIEMELMGTNISFNPFAPYVKKLGLDMLATAADIDAAPYNAGHLVILGSLTEVKNHVTKDKGEKMAFLKVENHLGETVEMVVFPDAWTDMKDRLAQGRVAVLCVRKDKRKDNGEDSLVLEGIRDCDIGEGK